MDRNKVIAEAFKLALEQSGLMERLEKVEAALSEVRSELNQQNKVHSVEREVMEGLIVEQVSEVKEMAESTITTLQGRLDLVEADQIELKNQLLQLQEAIEYDVNVLRGGIRSLVETLQNSGILEFEEAEDAGAVGKVHPVMEHLVKITEKLGDLEAKYEEIARMLRDMGSAIPEKEGVEKEPVSAVEPGEGGEEVPAEHPEKSDMEKVEEEVGGEEEAPAEEEESEEEVKVEEEEVKAEEAGEEEGQEGEESEEEEEGEAKGMEKAEKPEKLEAREAKVETVDQIFELLNSLTQGK